MNRIKRNSKRAERAKLLSVTNRAGYALVDHMNRLARRVGPGASAQGVFLADKSFKKVKKAA